MKRLNIDTRNAILSALLRHRFDKEELAVEQDFLKLASEVNASLHVSAARRLMESLPEGWLPTRKALHIKVPEGTRTIRLPEAQLCTYNDYHGPSIPLTGKLLKRWRTLTTKRESLTKAKHKVRAQARAILHSVTTVEKLSKVWPEVVPYIPKDVQPPQLPAVITKDLNRLLKI